ncbi:glycosyltransferase family 2 protein [bacterium]|nr:glycosyltransferase family 2 protein [bacterium]
MSAPRVTVVIPAFNRERFVGAAIESILAQSYPDFELLVIDDGSSDRTRDVVRACRDPRLRLLCHERNQGLPRVRNAGVDEARGQYLAFLDSDDVARPYRLARQVACLDRHPELAAVGAWIDWMDEQGRPLGRVKRRPVRPDDVAALRLFRQGIENTASLARTAILRQFRHDERFAVSEDFELWARVAGDHPIANLPEVLVRRRAHPQQTSRDRDEETRRYRQMIYARQLAALGVPFTEEDLRRHHLLRRMRKSGYAPDRAFVDWTEAWLRGLQAANAQTRRYPEPALSRLLGALWGRVCFDAAPSLGQAGAWRRFRASPLRRWTWAGVRGELALRGPRPLAWLAAHPSPAV